MALFDWINSYKARRQQMQLARLMSNYTPIFSQFGKNVYASDIVQVCIDIIAKEVSKLQPTHIRTDQEGMQSVPKTSLNRLFKFQPNPLMTTRDFLEKVIWQLYLNDNVFIYPTYDSVTLPTGGKGKSFTAFFPLAPEQVTFLQDTTGALFCEFSFAMGQTFTIAYSDVIHIRRKFSVNDIMGGGVNGQPDNKALLELLNVNHEVVQSLPKAIKTSLSLRGIMKINTMMDDDKLADERAKFEKAMRKGETGILAMDLKGEYIDLKPDPKLIDKTTMEFIQSKVYDWFGVSQPIVSGVFTDDEYEAFYQKTIEPIVIALGQSFSVSIFSQRELDVGNEVVFYQRNLMYLSTKAKLELIKTAGEQGLLTDDQKLAILGYPPLKDGAGNRRTISLNYVNTEIADQYQLTRAKAATNLVSVGGQKPAE